MIQQHIADAKARVANGEDALAVVEALAGTIAAAFNEEQRAAVKVAREKGDAVWQAKREQAHLARVWSAAVLAVETQIEAAKRLEQAFTPSARADLLAARDAAKMALDALDVRFPDELAITDA